MPSDMILARVESDEVSDTYGRFIAQPLEPGMATTMGNALRRVLLSSLPGAAVTWVQIEGVAHEFSTAPHVKEDTIELLLNLKGLRLRCLASHAGRLFLEVEGQGVVTAADIAPSAEFEVVNPELYLATLDAPEARLYIEMNVEPGKGYLPAGQVEGLPVGALPVDAIFTPVRKVNYTVEQVHAGQDASNDRLVLEVWTDATISPLEALSQGAEVMVGQLGPFVMLATETFTIAPRKPRFEVAPEQAAIAVEEMNFTVRTYNALKRGGIGTLGELLERSHRELMELRQFGPKAMDEVRERLQGMGFWAEEAEAEGAGEEAAEADEVAEETDEEAAETDEQAEEADDEAAETDEIAEETDEVEHEAS